MPTTSIRHRPVALIIRDGWGENPHPEHDSFNAVRLARTPVSDRLERTFPRTLIRTSGEDVGLPGSGPDAVMGNSEVGHQNIGAGRIVDQELMRITRAIRSGAFFENAALRNAFARAKSSGRVVHLLGLVSDGKVHSDLEHLLALLEMARREGLTREQVVLHAITDGRDTPPTSASGYLRTVEEAMTGLGMGRIASVIGRYYALDRDHRWDRVELAWKCLTTAIERHASTAQEALALYAAAPIDTGRSSDEFITPTQIGTPCPVRDGDSVIFFNFRGDRPRELTMAFVLDDACWTRQKNGGFDRGVRPTDLCFCTLTAYEEGLPVEVAFVKPPKMGSILAETLSVAGLTQFHCAETEKYAHVTFFFNDYREDPFPGERRVLIQSPTDVSTYDQRPEMSARAVCDAVLERIAAVDGEDAIIVNFANGDMVGHTGVLAAAIVACEVVDECVGRIVDALLARGGAAIVTADHGNAEQMWDPLHNCPHTAHTNFLVPCIVVAEELRGRHLRPDGRLADLAPTMLELLGVPTPAAMTGSSLVAE